MLAGPPLAFKDYRVYIEGTEADDKHLTIKQRAKFVGFSPYRKGLLESTFMRNQNHDELKGLLVTSKLGQILDGESMLVSGTIAPRL